MCPCLSKLNEVRSTFLQKIKLLQDIHLSVLKGLKVAECCLKAEQKHWDIIILIHTFST